MAHEFASAVIGAYGSKSVKACVALLPTKQEDRLIDTVVPFRFGYHRLTAKRFTKQVLKEKSKKIDQLNERSDSALTVANLDSIDTHDFVPDADAAVQVVPRITIRFKERSVDDRLVRAVIIVKEAAIVNQAMRNTHFLNVEIAETSRRNPEAVTRFTAIHDRQVLKGILEPVIGSEYTSYVLGDEWEMHEGDLQLETFDIKTNLIVTGDLSVDEPLVEIECSLVVFGTTTVRSLLLGEDNVFLMGGVQFAQALLSHHSGPTKVINRPVGPLLYSGCETTETYETSGVTCLFEDAIGNTPGDLQATVHPDYLLEHDDGQTTIDWDRTVSALESGSSILLSHAPD